MEAILIPLGKGLLGLSGVVSLLFFSVAPRVVIDEVQFEEIAPPEEIAPLENEQKKVIPEKE